ncbi:undecaprenyldiphospho-muramoylpentapeptide beta-N-acetylglucosaminyltransferase [Patescibacteria group bacterium]|jgi:UDP-N-acetylglucosamine--N-acetylmuramyl-(pentapeptide) pyrophosphoryl-undecaprenol N-acetylglucosamine transferase|nr:undecaprenyldiphospho-muramoylpentapeptide beta-N-acetylglucosaminyltransferase [Patescibacteria group bacterium]
MKILFTGGGTGGHFYPIIAVAEEVLRLAEEKNLLEPKLYYIGTTPYNEKALYENEITYLHAPAGKLRRYPSLRNVTDLFKTCFGTIKAIAILLRIFPDVIFSKGGYVSIPTILAARILAIPVIIHDSDAIPGRANLLAAGYAHRIAISYPQAIDHFPKKHHDKVAVVGVPVRKQILHPEHEGAHAFLGFTDDVPTILVLGGSQGAQRINETILEALPDLIDRYQVIHQVGPDHEETVVGTAGIALEGHAFKHRYKGFGHLDDLAMRMAAGAADLVIARAGSTTIFEVSAWGTPMILIPISEDVSRDQRKNAYAVARVGAGHVIEENNLSPHLLVSEVNRIMDNEEQRTQMSEATKELYRPDAATRIAEELLAICIKHERTD